jgi:hypothetical protein
MQRRHHYEHALEGYLRARRIPYIAIDEARKALLPESRRSALGALKSFDLVIYGHGSNLLVEVKGRRIVACRNHAPSGTRRRFSAVQPAPRLESWVTLDDVESLAQWESLFGPSFEAAFVFVYWCHDLPPDALFEEIFEDSGRWYAIRCVRLRDYAAAMRTRSPRWRTVHVPARDFDRLSGPLGVPRRSDRVSPDVSHLVDADLPPLSALDPLPGPP